MPIPFSRSAFTAIARRSLIIGDSGERVAHHRTQRPVQQMTNIDGHFQHAELLHNARRLVLVVNGDGWRAEFIR